MVAQLMPTSAPMAFRRSSLPSLEVAAITVAPACLASGTQQVPTAGRAEHQHRLSRLDPATECLLPTVPARMTRPWRTSTSRLHTTLQGGHDRL